MSWTDTTDYGGASNKTAGTQLVYILGSSVSGFEAYQPGELIIVAIAKDNASTTDGNTSEVTSITNSNATNTWTKIREFTNGQGGAASGATVSLWMTRNASLFTSANGDFITVNFSGSVTAKAIMVKGFTGLAALPTVVAGADLANDGAAPGAMTLTGLGNQGDYCFIRVFAAETNSVTSFSKTGTKWINLDAAVQGFTTSGGSSVTNMGIYGEACIADPQDGTLLPTASSISWQDADYDGTGYVLVGNASSVCNTSTDGITWAAHNMPSSQNWRVITAGAGKFYAYALGGGVSAVSTDHGASWTQSTVTGLGAGTTWYIAWDGTEYVAVNYNSTAAAHSTDGITYTAVTLPISQTWGYIASNGSGTTIAVPLGNLNTTSYVITTDHGHTWSTGTFPVTGLWSAITWNGSVFCAVSSTVTPFTNVAKVVTSSTGATGSWTQGSITNNFWDSVVWDGNRFVIGDSSSFNYVTSTNGLSWSAARQQFFGGALWGGGNGIVLGNGGQGLVLAFGTGAFYSQPSFSAVDMASVFVALKGGQDATANGTTITATASLIAGAASGEVIVGGDLLIATASFLAGIGYGDVATVQGETFVATASLIAGQAVAGPPVIAGGPMPLRLYFSGGGNNQTPNLSLGGQTSQQPLGVVSRQRATFQSTPTITGVTLEECAGNTLGNGTLSYDRSLGRLTWQANNSGSNYVNIGSDGSYFIGPLDAYLVVYVVNSLLPLTNANDTVVITDHTQDLFDDVTYSERQNGLIEYRGLYLKNETGAVINTLTLSVDQQPAFGTVEFALSGGTDVTFGTLSAAEVEAEQIVFFNDFSPWYEGDSTARTDLSDFYTWGVQPFFYGAPVIATSGAFFSNGTSTNLLTILDDEADSTNKLTGLTWLTSKTVTAMSAGLYLPFWVRRTIPASTPGAQEDNTFRLKILYR